MKRFGSRPFLCQSSWRCSVIAVSSSLHVFSGSTLAYYFIGRRKIYRDVSRMVGSVRFVCRRLFLVYALILWSVTWLVWVVGHSTQLKNSDFARSFPSGMVQEEWGWRGLYMELSLGPRRYSWAEVWACVGHATSSIGRVLSAAS